MTKDTQIVLPFTRFSGKNLQAAGRHLCSSLVSKLDRFFLTLGLLGWVLTLQATAPAAQNMPRAAPNLHPNPEITNADGWTLTGASYSSVSKGGGGSIQLKRGNTAIGPVIPITPGKTYTCGLYFLGQHAPTDFVRLSLKLYNARGDFIKHSNGASDWGYYRPGVWQEAVIIHHARENEWQMRILLSRDTAIDGSIPVHIDNVYCGEGMSFDQSPSPKKPFHGTLVQVDAAGNVSIRQRDGTFKREFLRCMFTLNRPDWDHYAKNAWNCNMWASSRNNAEKGVKAGLPYAFFQLAQYIHPGAWAQGKLDRLRKDLGEILDSPYADNLIGYYYDNESPEQFALASQVMSIVAEMDLKAGKRQRPIYILQGNPGRQLAYTDYADITGAYHLGGGRTQTPLLVLQQMHGQSSPVVFGQIQEENGKDSRKMKRQVLSVIEAGATAIGYWHKRPIEQELWYPDFPAIAAEALGCTPGKVCAGQTPP